MLDQVFMADLQNAVSLIQEPSSAINTSSGIHSRGDHLRRTRELIGVLMAFTHGDSPWSALLNDCPQLRLFGKEGYISSLLTLLCDNELKEELDSVAPGVRCRAFHIAICVVHVTVDGNGTLGQYSLSSNVFAKPRITVALI